MELNTKDTDLYLSNMDNYLINYTYPIEDVIQIFTSVIHNFLNHCEKAIYISNKQYLHYVIETGVDILHNVFSILYLYTKNLELAKQYTERGYYIYCEFIGKIGDSHHKYLQLTSKDASLFVLKKTIYDINHSYTRNFSLTDDEALYIDNIKQYSGLYIQCFKIFLSIHYNLNGPETIDASAISLFPLHHLDELTGSILNIEQSNVPSVEKSMQNMFDITITTEENDYIPRLIEKIKYGATKVGKEVGKEVDKDTKAPWKFKPETHSFEKEEHVAEFYTCIHDTINNIFTHCCK